MCGRTALKLHEESTCAYGRFFVMEEKGGDRLNTLLGRLKVDDTLGGRYRIERLLGKGGMGTVYLAKDMKLHNKRWAIKESNAYAVKRQQFIDEAEMLIHLNHPFLPSIVDYYPPDVEGFSYLVMEYVEGQTLQQLFDSQRKHMTVDQLLPYCAQLCDLFDYLHQQRPKPIIYRDLKPSNIMIDAHNHVRLIDFGIARNFKEGQRSDTLALGTIGFAAPEQFNKHQSDHRTDLYNLGAMMYYLLSKGRYYYTEQKSIGMVEQKLPEAVISLIDQLLKSKPNERIQSALEVKKQIDLILKKKNEVSVTDTHKFVKNKMILIGSLYSGAGATYVTVAIARILNQYKLTCAVVEYPTIKPELYELLNGDHDRPDHYQFLSDLLVEENQEEKSSPLWRKDHTIWYPLRPKTYKQVEWTLQHHYKMLYSVNCPFILIDVAEQWEEPGVIELCKEADEIIMVADAFPHRLANSKTLERLMTACQLQKIKKNVHFVANRATNSFSHKEWFDMLPWSPVCKLLNTSYEDIMASLWRGSLVQDQQQVLKKLKQEMQPLLSKMIPKPLLSQAYDLPNKRFWNLWR